MVLQVQTQETCAVDESYYTGPTRQNELDRHKIGSRSAFKGQYVDHGMGADDANHLSEVCMFLSY